MMKKIIVPFILLLVIAPKCFAACTETSPGVWTPSSGCEEADIQACIDNAGFGDGDTISISGSCEWTTQISVPNTKGIVLQGSGKDSTTITDAVVTNPALLISCAAANQTIRITGISFQTSILKNDGVVKFIGAETAFIVDNCKFTTNTPSAGARAINIVASGGELYGLIHSNSFYHTTSFSQKALSITGLGDTSWAADINRGTASAVFIENNDFYFTYKGDGAIDAYDGAKVVFRYNNSYGTTHFSHGYDSGSNRSTMYVSNYRNVSDVSGSYNNGGSAVPSYWHSRGGTGEVFQNTVTGNYSYLGYLLNYRSNPYFEGTHTGGDSNTILVDANVTANCATDGFNEATTNWPYCGGHAAEIGYRIYNSTDGSVCQITGITNNTTLVCDGLAGGADNTFHAGDVYSIVNFNCPTGMCNGLATGDGNAVGGEGYYCKDQIGRGKDQALDPFYFFRNTLDGALQDIDVQATQSTRAKTKHLIEERDFYNEVAIGSAGVDGIAVGTKAQMPSTCTDDNTAFWVTDEGNWNKIPGGDQGQLYKCSSSTWSLYYTPYEYPHPLRGYSATAIMQQATQAAQGQSTQAQSTGRVMGTQ